MMTTNNNEAKAVGISPTLLKRTDVRKFSITKNFLRMRYKPLGLYLHIPFCMEKCRYCDFLSFGGTDKDSQKAYIQALVREISYYGKVYGKKYYVDTIFIGGGTPSLVEEALTAELITAVRANFNVAPACEVTIESNPKTLSEEKLQTYLTAGINRLSIGAQSLDNRLLDFMGRVHNEADFLENYYLARSCGFKNINVDLMFSIPGQTLEIWVDTLKKILKLQPEHLSFYSLQLEEGTHFYRMFQQGKLELIEDEADREMYAAALKLLKEKSYNHYEISNAAKMGFECKHNLKYWSMDDYLGMGLGAHSYMNGLRSSNLQVLKDYIRASENFGLIQAAENQVWISPMVEWTHQNTREDDISEFLFTGLRKIEGISLYAFQQRFGQPLESLYGKTIEGFIKDELLTVQDGMLRFTTKGIDISNRVLVEFV